MKPSLPKGTRDFSPAEVAKRNYITQIIKHNFEKYGYQPIETPSFENSETLMGKYGEEGDRLIFKILNSGDFYEKNLEDLLLNDDIGVSLYVFLQNIAKELSEYVMREKLSKINRVDDEVRLNIKSDNEVIKQLNSIIASWSLIFSDQILMESIKNILLENNKYFIIKIVDDLWNLGSGFEEKKDLNYLKDDIVLNIRLLKELRLFILEKLKENYNIKDVFSIKIATEISEKALRYDLTVPFARYVVQHQNEIEFPFKRYQIQPVWRADRPQKGRFREFYQCDADVVGSTSLWQEVELVQLYDAVFTELGLDGVTIKINNRKILSGIAEVIGASDKLIDFTIALDKLDKIGEDGVKKEMLEKGISEVAIQKVQPLFQFSGTILEKINKLSQLLASSVEGMKGVSELQFICENVTQLGLQKSFLDLDVTLARGLNYYTGAIFEVEPPKGVSMGSIGGGGRYDDLTGIFGLKNMSGVGISFGLDRIYLVIEELNLFPEKAINGVQVLFLNNGEQTALETMQAIHKLRNLNIQVDFYPDASKIDKQFKHAERRQIPFVVKEIKDAKFVLKNLVSGLQEDLSFEELAIRIFN